MAAEEGLAGYPDAYLTFLAHYHGDRDFFECHEVLEEYWKGLVEADGKEIWPALIRAAVGMYHYRRGNLAGAAKSLRSALAAAPEHLERLGIDAAGWRAMLEDALAALAGGKPYQDRDIPIRDEALAAAVRRRCAAAAGRPFGSPSPMDDETIIHRHLTRDRTEVIEARRRALASRRGGPRR